MPKVFVAIGFIVLWFVLSIPTNAAISSCNVSVSPSSITLSSASGISFSIENTSSDTIQWVQVTRPNGSFEIVGTSASGWNASHTASTATFTGGGSITAGSSGSVSVIATASEETSGSWVVQVSDQTSGASPTTCSGSTSVSAQGSDSGGDDSDPPTIGSISVTSISSSSAVVNWTTSETASGTVEYGTSESYGSTQESSSGTSHSVTLSGLSAQTRYHYKIEAYDESGNSTSSGDNVFETQPSGSTSTSSTTGSTSTSTTRSSGSSTSVVTGGSDTTRPVVSLSTDLSKPFVSAPTIEGRAVDTNGIGKVEYSTDNGTNWLPVDRVTYTSDESATFTFRPSVFDDNNYSIRARASDRAGNVGLSRQYTLVIDALPPSSAGYIVVLGSQLLSPQGISYQIPSNGETSLILAARGGPTQMNISFEGTQNYTFEAKKNIESGFWESTIQIPEAGDYQVTVLSVDGAQNETIEQLGLFVVIPAAQVRAREPLEDVRVTVYKYNEILKQFLLWDATPYDQVNPINTNARGVFSFVLPAGEFYLEFSKAGYKTLRTSLLTVDTPTIISQTFTLTPGRSGLLGLYRVDTTDIVLPQDSTIPTPSVPESFSFATSSRTYTYADIVKTPTLLAILPSWMPQFSQIAGMLSQVNASTFIISPSDTLANLSTLQNQGGYTTSLATDPTGSLNELGVSVYPTFLYIQGDRVVMKTGNLSIDDVRSFIQ